CRRSFRARRPGRARYPSASPAAPLRATASSRGAASGSIRRGPATPGRATSSPSARCRAALARGAPPLVRTSRSGPPTCRHPAYRQPSSTISLFKLVDDGRYAVRVPVEIGRTSVNAVEIVQGLVPGDEVVLSDTSAYDDYDRIRLN